MDKTIKNNKSLLASIADYKEFNFQLGICPITGIATEIKIPKFEGAEVLEYRNPLSYPKTAEDFALQPTEILSKIPTEILTGILLSLIHHKRLNSTEDKTSSLEKSIIIRNNCNTYSIVESIQRVARIPRKEFEQLPKIDFNAFLVDSNYGAIQANILSYFQECLSILFPTKELSNSTSEAMDRILAMIPDKKKPSLVEIVKTSKLHLKNLEAENIASPRLINFLRIVLNGENLIATGADNRIKLVERLELLDSHSATEIAKLIKVLDSTATANKEQLDLSLSQQLKQENETAESKTLTAKEKLLQILASKTSKAKEVSNHDEL